MDWGDFPNGSSTKNAILPDRKFRDEKFMLGYTHFCWFDSGIFGIIPHVLDAFPQMGPAKEILF